MNRLYKRTETLRRMVDQNARIILMPEEDIPADVGGEGKSIYRRVQAIVPSQPSVFFEVDGKIQGAFDQPGQGPDRTYNRPKLESGAQIDVSILPEQHIVAQAESGKAIITLIVEYWEES